MTNSGHHAMLEHGTVYLYIKYGSPLEDDNEYFKLVDIAIKYKKNKYSYVNAKVENTYWHHCWITTNYRVLVENGWLDDLQYQCEPTEHHEKRVTVKFICDRGVSHEFVRHRVFSFAQESTRYCNYSKSKFGGELTCIIPDWAEHFDCFSEYTTALLEQENVQDLEELSTAEYRFIQSLCNAEDNYFALLEQQCTAQQARAVLPNAVKTELVMTGFISDWKHFFGLRCHSTAHPDAKALAIPLKETFIEKGYLNG
jgi:thymidylate synthase (FAD)